VLIVLIALTGFADDNFDAADFDHVLLKPVDPDALKRLLDEQARGVR